MGIISYFKNLHYDNKLNKAGRLLSEGRPQEAEDIYLSLVDKHPQAACKLAEFYYAQSSKADVKKDIALFKKTVDLKKLGAGIYDASTYDPVLSNYVKHIKSRASSCFESGAFDDCFALSSTLKETKTGSKEVNVLCSEAKIRLLFRDIEQTKVTSNSFKPLVEAFKQEWPACKDKQRAKKSALQFCDQLINAKRFYASNELLAIILDNRYDDKCLNNAVQIVRKCDSEVSDNLVKTVVKSLGKRLVFREGIPQEESVSLFDACWLSSSDENVVMDLLKSAPETSLRDAFIAKIIDNHSAYLSSAKLLREFTSWLFNAFDGTDSLDRLEKVHKLGYDVKEFFTKKTHDLTIGMSCDESLPHLDRAIKLFPDSSIIIDDKLNCAQRYLNDGKNEKAVAVAESILDKRDNAKLVKAHALCNLAGSEPNLDKRIELLEKAQSALSSCSGPEKRVITTCINDAFILAAKLYYSEGQIDKSYTVLTGLAKKGVDNAAYAMASFRLQEVQTVQSAEDKLTRATDAIGELRRFGISSIVTNVDYLHLWDEKIEALLVKYKALDNQSAVTHYQSLVNEIDSAGFDASVTKDKKAIVVKQIIKRKYLIARDSEQNGDFTSAATLYKEINALEAKKVPTLSALRFMLCKLKSQNSAEILGHRERIYTLLRNAAEAYKSEKEDIAYRFALILLKAGEDKEALSVLGEFLPGEEKLKKACEQGAVIKALAKLDDFNEKLEAVRNKTLSSNDAVYFINHMLEYAETIKPVLELPRSILSRYRNKLKNYAIFKLFDEARYDVAFEKMIKEHQDYLDDYTALRNIALICLNMAESKQISNDNYQEVIAVWLTAIYQEKLFIKSLDYTSWDDQFTFSLYEAYGHFNEDSVGDLPDNVNFSDSDDSSVVLIKEVQRALLDRFEAAISDTQRYHDFFTSQKDTMDAFIALNLDEKCRIVAPYLAHKEESVFQDISDALEQDREQEYDNWEDVLAVGALYQMPQSIYGDYSKAKSYYEDCIAAIDTVSTNRARLAFTSSKIDLVSRFDKLSSALTSYCNSKISALSPRNKADFKNNYSFYLTVCSSMKDRTLSFIFSNYVMQYVVGEVNGNTMSKSDAADIILSIFLLDKNNSKVKENLTTLFEMLSHDSSAASVQAVTNVLNRIQTFDPSFYTKLKNEYEQAKIDKELNDIVDKVNKNQLSEAKALERVYALYTTNQNNTRICENLVQLCDMCIAKYIVKQEYGGSSVSTILDRLKGNMSITFKRYSVKLKQTYQSIWNSLPSDAKLTLKGLNPHATLNSSGQALKRGLDYYKALGGVSDTSSLSDIFGLL